ncbi:putative RNA-directed DNA polymerase from transposon BS [Amphibalanus amphitrite]|uniref:Putative RNA-directed DNA polymerase from transposon BS n=1 Tax=Amphibalanus amphitrite TaxID=1232801 RepID=A0A6A4VA55_AMPAM|nr:putative RNA-directed DNA polymerase from transposon BS [Amphibalanus amphitrite]
MYVRDSRNFTVLDGPFKPGVDDTTEICGVRILGPLELDLINIYRPPIRPDESDERQDLFDPTHLPSGDSTIVAGDLNAHHPLWDADCDEADEVGERIATWLDSIGWTTLNDGRPTFTSYRSGGQTAPDAAFCSPSLARRTKWSIGPDLGSDHLPMLLEIRTGGAPPKMIRKTRWSFKKADWLAFQEECEAAFAEAGPEHESVQELATRFHQAPEEASVRHIPRGARNRPRPWALDPELKEAVDARRAARRDLRSGDRSAKERWVEAKRRAASVERRVSQRQFREYVSTTLNKHQSLGRVHKTLKMWEGASDDQHRAAESMEDGDRTLVSDRDKANAFNRTYATVSKQVRDRKVDRDTKTRLKASNVKTCHECWGRRSGYCSPFSEEELTRQISQAQLKKSPGPDDLCNEHIKHLGPRAREVLLHLINSSWQSGVVPREWRRAVIVPIPKVGKDPRKIASYRPIALTSHVAKLAERVIATRLSHLAAERNMIPPEQVGFREKRGVEDVVARLTQQVQDGWQLKPCPPSRRQVPDGEAAQKYVLVAYDFSRAYDRVDHRLLRARLAELGIPACYNTWVWAFLRDRRACVEVNGTKSGERVYRAGLPQGSVLSPTLFLLWSAPLVATLKTLPGTTPFMFADDTSTLCAGNSIAVARDRAQLAANTLVKWARRSKMEVAGQKTQLLVLSQNPRDAVDCHIHVAGQLVEGGPELKLLGVTLDRTLSFGPHCRSLRRRVRPRAAQLRRLTGRSWGLQEQQLRAVANGYVRGAIEHAAAAWLPAVSKSNIEILEREMRAVARIVTGCIHSAPHHGVTAEAGMLPVAARRTALAARMFAKAAALPPEDPLRAVAMADPPQRLKLVTGWRQVGREALRELRVELPVEALLPERPPPWTPTGKITFNLSIGALPAGAARSTKRDAALHHLASMTQCATWAWTDGSSSGGILRGGAGALIVGADDSRTELRVPAGTLCSSFRAEMVALQVTLDHILEHQRDAPEPVIICTDSLSAVAALREASDIVWFKDGRRLPAAASRPALQLTGGNRSVAGMYQCHVTDDLATTQVRIGALPARLLLSLVQQTVQPVVDTAITFTCAATSSPPPAVTWTRDGVSADQLGGRFHVQDSTSGVKDVTSQLTIQQVSRFSRCHS